MQPVASRLFALCLLSLLFVSTLGLVCIYWRIYGVAKLFGDFDTFRGAAIHAAAHQYSAVYDVANAQHLLETNSLTEFSYFLNPPTGLFLVWPLAFLSHAPGLLLWTFLQIAVLFLGLRTAYMRRLFATSSQHAIPAYALLGIAFLAFSLQNILFGQVAILCVSLFILVLALRRTHPVWAGILLGIFSFKPQLGVLLPVVLLAEKNWKTLLWAALTASIMALLSVEIFGAQLWRDYGAMLQVRSRFLATDPSLLFAISTSPYAAFRILGMQAGAAFTCQSVLSLLVLVLIWPVLRRGEESYKILIVTLATYLVTPYSLIYDIPLLAIPCALLLRRTEADKATHAELLTLLLLIILPLVVLLLQLGHIPYSVVAISAALGVARLRPQYEHQDT